MKMMTRDYKEITELHVKLRMPEQSGKGIILYKLPFNTSSTRDENSFVVNSVDLDEMAQNEPPHLDLHCLPYSL